MRILTKQANFLLPKELLEDLKKNVPRMEQSKVVAEALKKELKRIKLRKALKESFGAWKNGDHPELAEGTDKYIRRIRKSSRTMKCRKDGVKRTGSDLESRIHNSSYFLCL